MEGNQENQAGISPELECKTFQKSSSCSKTHQLVVPNAGALEPTVGRANGCWKGNTEFGPMTTGGTDPSAVELPA